MVELGSLDSSRKVTPIREKGFANKLYLVLHAYIRLFVKKKNQEANQTWPFIHLEKGK